MPSSNKANTTGVPTLAYFYCGSWVGLSDDAKIPIETVRQIEDRRNLRSRRSGKHDLLPMQADINGSVDDGRAATQVFRPQTAFPPSHERRRLTGNPEHGATNWIGRPAFRVALARH